MSIEFSGGRIRTEHLPILKTKSMPVELARRISPHFE